MDTDAIVIGAGLAGLVATAELADAGRKVMLLDQEPEASLGGQAFWSLGGLMLVDSPEQRRLPPPLSPASTPSARSPTSCTAAMTTRGSC